MSPWVLLSTDSDSNSNNHKTDVVTKAVLKRGDPCRPSSISNFVHRTLTCSRRVV
ncbi:hypothetical protein M378DRAFT_169694 [Amanita muscaria Koide BX008]|uniref:Uncharacterized protein n=1 Tax=Amanita muscaria (strain Koide BX008) TaxID=946122 RepID=A0A0C2WS71_AMAMK|nr:hypothetical protein M378DRAFT_169694 [Amanita muscaria Koide BX008]